MLEEKCEKIENDLNELNNGNYKKHEIVDMIEISSVLSIMDELESFLELLEYANDGINTYALFIKNCYDKFSKSSYCDMYSFLNENLDDCMQEFKDTYFIEKE